MALYEKILGLFEKHVGSDCSQKAIRTQLAPLLMSMDSYEKERAIGIRQKVFNEVCTEFQWYYWTSEDYYGGVGDWREFPPVCTSQLNKAMRNNKTSVQTTIAQREYIVDFTEMTKRLVQDNAAAAIHHGQYTVPIFVKAFKKEGFSIDKFFQILEKLNAKNSKHVSIIKGTLKLLESSNSEPLDVELAYTALTLLYRLVTHEGMAEEFLKMNGIQTLMKLRCTEPTVNNSLTTSLIFTMISLIFRHCIDSEEGVLKEAYEGMIKNTCTGMPISLLEATSRRNALRAKRYQKDPKRVFRLLAPLAAIAPRIFVESIKNCLVLKKGELQLKEAIKGNGCDSKHENLKKILRAVIQELFPLLESKLQCDCGAPAKTDQVLQPAILLKFMAEIIRNYPTAPLIFVQMTVSDGQSVLKRIIDKFLLNTNEDGKSVAPEVAISAKAVLSSLISCHTTSKVTDQIVDDLKALLCAVTDDCMKGLCATTDSTEKAKLATKYADLLTVLARLTMHLRETVSNLTNAFFPMGTRQVATALTKSIQKKNLLNDFIKAIWSLPLHERQGIDAVNTLLKLFEVVIGKDNSGLLVASAPETDRPDRQQLNTARTSEEQANPNMDVDSASTTNALNDVQQVQQQDETSRNSHDESMGTADNTADQPVLTLSLEGYEEDHDHAMNDTESHLDDTSSNQTDEEMAEEDMEVAAQEAAAEAEDMDDDQNSFHMLDITAQPNNHQNNLVVDEVADDIDDDDDDDDDEEEDEEDDGEGDEHEHEESLVEFEDAIMEMAEFANITNEMNMIRQDINRINTNINQAFAAQHFQQALMQMPRNVRALIGHHPRGGAVLRIRPEVEQFLASGHQNRAHRAHIPIQIGINYGGGRTGGRESFVAQLMNHLSGGQWPGGAIAREAGAEEQALIPYFLDRLSDQCRIMDPNSPFHIGTILTSFLLSAIETPPDEPPSQPKQSNDAANKKEEEVKMTTAGEQQPAVIPPQQEEVQANLAAASDDHDQLMQQDGQPNAEAQAPAVENNEQMAIVDQEMPMAAAATAYTPAADNHSQQPQAETEQQSTSQQAPVVEQTATSAPIQAGAQGNAQNQQVDGVPVPEGVDPAFLAALPEDMRQEVIRDHLLQQQLNDTPATQPADHELPPDRLAAILGMEVPEGMDPAFLAALPEDIFQEVVRDHQRQQELARHRQAQREAAQAAHHHAHHRHFPMHHFFGSRLMRGGAGGSQQQIPTHNLSNEKALQLLDRESICTLFLLYFLDQEKFNIIRLQKLLRNVCINPASCDFTIWALLSMLDGLEKFDAIDFDIESEKSQLGWINNIRMSASFDKNERIIQITPNSICINQQVRTTTAHHIVDTLCYLAQRFANHFMPKSYRDGSNKCEAPPNMSFFWNIVKSINNKNTEDALKDSTKSGNLQEMAADTLDKSPFAFIIKLAGSKLARNSQTFMDKLIRTTLMLSQGLTYDIHGKTSVETRHWVGQRLNDLMNILMEKSTDDSLRDGRALVAQLLGTFPSERQLILGALHEGILQHGSQLREQLNGLRDELKSKPKTEDEGHPK